MNRRKYIANTGTILTGIALAGCSSSTGASGGPKYSTSTSTAAKEKMMLGIDAFPNEWKRNDKYNDNFDAVFLNSDESIVVLIEVELGMNVKSAKKGFDNARDGFRDPQKIDIGDEAFWDTQNKRLADTIFRDSNAVGGVAALNQYGMEVKPDQTRSQSYARDLYKHWQEL